MKTFIIITISFLVGIAFGKGFTEAKITNDMKKLACNSTYDDNSEIVDCIAAITTDNIVVFERGGLSRIMGE